MKKLFLLSAAALAIAFTGCKGDDPHTQGPGFWVKPTGATIDKKTLALDAEQKGTLKAVFTPADTFNKNVVWESSDKKIASVSTTGEVSAGYLGTATVKFTSVDGGFTDNCVVTVSLPKDGKAVESLTLDNSTLSVEMGKKGTLVASVLPTDATGVAVIWETSDSKIATVTDGVVTPVAVGTAKITATSKYGEKSAEATVNIIAAVPAGE